MFALKAKNPVSEHLAKIVKSPIPTLTLVPLFGKMGNRAVVGRWPILYNEQDRYWAFNLALRTEKYR